MGGKKKGKKGKGKKKEEPLPQATPEETNQALLAELHSLQQRQVLESERANSERAAENELKSKVTVLSHEYDQEVQRTWDVTCDMTRQYKSMQAEKDKRIQTLTKLIEENEEMIKARDAELADTLKKKENVIKQRDEEIRDLRDRIKEMSHKFSEMLKSTLDQMSQKIELVNQNFEEEIEPTMVKKLEEFTKVPGLTANP